MNSLYAPECLIIELTKYNLHVSTVSGNTLGCIADHVCIPPITSSMPFTSSSIYNLYMHYSKNAMHCCYGLYQEVIILPATSNTFYTFRPGVLPAPLPCIYTDISLNIFYILQHFVVQYAHSPCHTTGNYINHFSALQWNN